MGGPLCIIVITGKTRRAPVRRLGKCLLISARMPGCFLIRILQYTAVAHLLIIQKESCGYLMLCCRAFFFSALFLHCIYPSLLLRISFVLYLVLCRTSLPLALCFFQKSKNLCSVALLPKVNTNVCMLEIVLPFHAAGDFTVFSSKNRIPCSLIPPCLHY